MADERGALIISIDFEMAWGIVHRNGDVTYDVEDERRWVTELLDVFDRYAIPATWATVGHLLLDECGAPGAKHADIQRPDYPWFRGDWFDQDPCSSVDEEPRWYAPDVVADLLSRPAGHELACHSFSHVLVGDPGCSAGAFSSELAACDAAAARFDADLRSFVYPRNNIGHVDELVRHGYTSYRGQRPDPFARRGRLGEVARRLDQVVPSSSSVVRPLPEPGIWNLPATCLFSTEGRRLPRLWARQTRRRLRHAARHGGLFHVWFHPHNIVRGGQVSLDLFEELLGDAARLRDAGRLDTVTMGTYADRLGPPAGAAGALLDAGGQA